MEPIDVNKTTVVSYEDVLFHKYIPQALLNMSDDYVIAVDINWKEIVNRDRQADSVNCTMSSSRRSFASKVFLNHIEENLPNAETHGEWMSFMENFCERMPVFKEI
ncbi:MAG: hypothetical protein NPIRA02_16290 [Nitrospirales bacterium]|nr:MAG: hypothetical protein NPIRA02_16290 [Nitrospirales bacterium]